MTLALAACARGSEPAAAPSGGTLVVAMPGDADVLLPPVTSSLASLNIADRIYPRLAEIGAGLNTVDDSAFAPSLARHWEHRDSVTLVFHLDPRARWQDGPAVTADDVVFTFALYTDPLVAAPLRPNLAAIASVTKDGSLTVVFRFRRRYPEQLFDATYHMRIVPRHLLDSIPRARLASAALGRAPVGVGPFRFVRWEAGAVIELAADTASFFGRPRLDRLVFRVLPDVSAAVSALIAGEADAIEVIPQRDEIERALQAPDLRLIPYPSPFLAGIVFNLRPGRLFADQRLRHAIALAVDRETIVRSIFGPFGQVPAGAASPQQWIATLPVRQFPFDTAQARRELGALGWRDATGDGMLSRQGVPLRFTLLVPTTSRLRQQAAVLLQAELKAVGVDLRILPLEFNLFQRRTAAGDFDASFFSLTLDPTPSSLRQFWSSASVGGDNVGGYASPAFDSILAEAVAAPSRAAAAPLWAAALDRLNDDVPAIFLYAPRNNAAVHRRFDGVSIRPDSWLATVAAWSVPPDRRLPRDRAGLAGR